MKRIRISRVFPTVILLICAIVFSGCGIKSDPPIASQVQSAPYNGSRRRRDECDNRIFSCRLSV